MKTKSRTGRALAKKLADRVFDDAVVSAAFERYLDLAWTSAKQETVRGRVGAGNYARIEEILAFASNQAAWLNATNLSAAADTVSGKLSQSYPRLSDEAVFRIVSHATYGWR